MNKILVFDVLLVLAGLLFWVCRSGTPSVEDRRVATSAATREPPKASDSSGGVEPSRDAVDLDFTAMNDTIRLARFVELMRCPQSSTGKTVRLFGRAIYTVDITGKTHCRIVVPDPLGCCGIGVVEYFPTSTNALPKKGSMFVLKGTIEIPPRETDSSFIITGATTRQTQN